MATTSKHRRRRFALASFILSGISIAGVRATSDCSLSSSSALLGERLRPHSRRGGRAANGRSFGGCSRSLHVPSAFPWNVRGGGDDDEDDDNDNSSSDDENNEEEEDWRLDLPQSPYDYVSPSALDSYGGSPQIRNAHQAAVGPYGGTIVVAAVATGPRDSQGGNNDASVICCSLRRVRKGLRSTRLGSSGDGSGGSSAIHVVSCADSVPEVVDDVKTSSTTAFSTPANSAVALAASGLKPDLNLLLTLIRTRSVEVWDRYDVPPGPIDVAESISQAFLSFLGYDRDKEAGDGIGPLRDDNNAGDNGRDNKFQMSRPFGLEVMVLGVGWNGGQDINGSSILSVGPSGMVRGPFVAHAVGRGHELANNLLKKEWVVGMDEASVRRLCIDTIKKVAEEEMEIALNDNGDEEEGGGAMKSLDGWEIVCETLSSAAGGEIHSTRYALAR